MTKERIEDRDQFVGGRRSLLLGAVVAALAWPISVFAPGGSAVGAQTVIRRSSPLRGHGLVWILRDDD